MKTKGTTPIAMLINPSKLQLQAMPSFVYMGLAAKGTTTPNMLREHDAAPIALAAKTSYASTM